MQEVILKTLGGTIYWSTGPTLRELLDEGMTQLGHGDLVPPAKTDAGALSEALKEYCDKRTRRKRGKNTLVQSLKSPKKNGYQVLDVERGEDDNDYSKSFSAKVRDGKVVVKRGDADRDELQELFEVHKATLNSSAVGQALVSVIERLGGTTLKPNGGLYWIPEEAVQVWRDVAKAVEGCATDPGSTKIYLGRMVLDEDSIRQVKDAIIMEVTEASDRLRKEIAENELGGVALVTRQFTAAAMHARVTQYETILGQALEELHEIVRLAEEACASAVAIRESENVYEGVF